MPSTIGFSLNFSGSDVLQQQQKVAAVLNQTPAESHADRARLWAVLAATQVFLAPDEARRSATASAQAAECAGDEISRAWSLLGGCLVDLSCAATGERHEATRQIIEIAGEHDELELIEPAVLLHLGALAELGRIAELDQAISPTGPILSRFPSLQDSRQISWFRCLRATLDGDVKAAEHFADAAHELAERSGDPDAHSTWVGQRAILSWMQGHVVEYEPLFLHARRESPHEPVWAVSLAWMWLKQGRKSAARALVASLPAVGDLPVDRNWLSTACILATVAAELGDVATMAELQVALSPFADRLVTIGLGVTCWGTVARPLALMANALGDRDEAVRYYRVCVESAATMGAHPWLAEAQAELAWLLSDRSDHDARGEALELATEAAATARALQLHEIETMATSVLVDLRRTESSVTSIANAESQPKVRVMGGFVVVSSDGLMAHWQSRKARQLLKILVARRGVAVGRESVIHMLWPDEAPEQVANRFFVAASTIRKALDPAGQFPREHFLQTRGGLVRLAVERLAIDVEQFLSRSRSALESDAKPAHRVKLLAETFELYRGDPFTDETDEMWADELRREIHMAYFAVGHALADVAKELGDHLTRAETYRAILTFDPYDQAAHEGLTDALVQLGAHGRAAVAREEYAERMDELGVGL